VPAADQAGVEEIDAFVAWRYDLSILFGEKHHIARADGELGRADSDFERHLSTWSPG
jgi:hypothetical protein